MVAYRFCRPDDSPYIVRAVNECFQVHFPDEPTLTLEDFRTEIRELDVWPSNCMVASEASRPIAVCVATKRPEEVLIYRVGARPGFERQGHGSHMLTSLSQKLAVLGPSRLVAELPDEPNLTGFFEAAGYALETRFTDYVLSEPLAPPPDASLLTPIEVGDVLQLDLPDDDLEICWERQQQTLQARRQRITGWGMVAGDTLAGFVLYWDQDGERQLLAKHFEPETSAIAARWLLGQCCRGGGPFRLLKTAAGEWEPDLLQRLGFEADAVTLRYTSTAQPL